MSQTTPAPAADDEIDLGRLFGLLLDHKWLIIAVTALFAIAGIVYATLATPIYQSDALVQVERRSSVSPLGDMASVLDRKSTRLNSSHVAISYAVFCLKQKSL